MQFDGVTFKNQRVRLDEGEFRNCTFDDVILEYAGGPLSLDGCAFRNRVGWSFEGDFGRGLAALGALYATRQPLALKIIVDAMFPRPVSKPARAEYRKAA